MRCVATELPGHHRLGVVTLGGAAGDGGHGGGRTARPEPAGTVIHPLERVNEAISGTARHDGRFPNLIVSPLVTA